MTTVFSLAEAERMLHRTVDLHEFASTIVLRCQLQHLRYTLVTGHCFETAKAEYHLLRDFLVSCEKTQDLGRFPPMRDLVPKEVDFPRVIALLELIARDRIRRDFASVGSIALCADSYRNVGGRDVIGVTAHRLDANFNLHSAVIGVKEADFSQTGGAIAGRIRETANGMFPQPTMMISSIVTDHAANYAAAGRLITEDSVGCAAHLLQLVVHDVCGKKLPEMHELLKSVSSFTVSIRQRKGSLRVMDQMRVAKGEKPLRPVSNVSTRWNSDFLMVVRYLTLAKDYRATTASLGAGDVEQPPQATSKDLRLYARYMRPLFVATEQLSADECPTLCQVPSVVWRLHQEVAALKSCELKDSLLRSIRTRLMPVLETPSLALMAAIVAPYYSDLESLHVRQDVQVQVLDKIALLARELERVNTGKDVGPRALEVIRKVLDVMAADFKGMSVEEKKQWKNPLAYWKAEGNQKMYAMILPVVRLLLAIPASSTPVERLFSVFTYIHSKRRVRLRTSVASKSVFIASNMGPTQPPITDDEVQRLQEMLDAEAATSPVVIDELEEIDEENSVPDAEEVTAAEGVDDSLE